MEKNSNLDGLSEMAIEIVSRKKPQAGKDGKNLSKNGSGAHKNGNGIHKNGDEASTMTNGHSKNNGAGKEKLNGKNGQSKERYEDLEIVDAANLLSVLMEVKNGNFNVKMPID